MAKFKTSDGVDIHYHVDDFREPWIGEPAEVVLMHHGFARNMKFWTQWVPVLATQYRVVRYDVRGCGQSEVPLPDADWSGPRLVKDALDLLNHLSIDNVHWVGFHSGGVLGELFAITYPHRVKSLVLVNTPAGRLSPENLATHAVGEENSLVAMKKYGFRTWLERTNAARLDLGKASPQLVEWHTSEMAKTPFHVAYALHSTFCGADISKLLHKIRVPTLLIASDRSPICTLEAQHAMEQQIPNLKLLVHEGIGEGIFLLEGDRCARETWEFLDSLRQ